MALMCACAPDNGQNSSASSGGSERWRDRGGCSRRLCRRDQKLLPHQDSLSGNPSASPETAASILITAASTSWPEEHNVPAGGGIGICESYCDQRHYYRVGAAQEVPLHGVSVERGGYGERIRTLQRHHDD